jgi:hypothetical protein
VSTKVPTVTWSTRVPVPQFFDVEQEPTKNHDEKVLQYLFVFRQYARPIRGTD